MFRVDQRTTIEFASIADFPHDFADQLNNLTQQHPDQSRANLYQAYWDLLFNDFQPKLAELITTHLPSSATSSEVQHFLNLLVHTMVGEYLFLTNSDLVDTITSELGLQDKHYSQFTAEDWKRSVLTLLEDEQIYAATREQLSSKSTQTFVFQRYLGTHLVLNKIYQKPIVAVDAGCSLGLGLHGMESRDIDIYEPLEHNCLGEDFVNLLRPVQIGQGYALDTTPLDQDWILACSFYPGESISQLPRVRNLVAELQTEEHPNIIDQRGERGDATYLHEEFEPASVDVIIANTMLYQLSPEQRDRFFASAQIVLKPGGKIIVTDFARKHEESLSFDGKWFDGSDPNKYRLFVIEKGEQGLLPPKEILKFPNARCKKVFPGDDFDSLF